MSEPWLSTTDITGHLDVTKDTVQLCLRENYVVPQDRPPWRLQTRAVDKWGRGGGSALLGE